MLKPLSQEGEARLPPDLVQALREGRALALIGAGLSRALGFPSWTGLLRELAAQTLQDFGDTQEAREKLLAKSVGVPEWVGEVLKHHSPDAYVRTLRRIFADYPPPRFSINHALLAALPFRGYLTTNYDHLVEDYVEAVDSVVPFVATPFQNENPAAFIREDSRFVLKIHGCAVRDAGRLILASSEYFDLVREPRYERALAYLFQRYSIVTLGFGLADRDLTRFIEERRHLYGNRCPTVYALVPNTEITPWEMEVYRSAYNVVAIPVNPEDGFAELSSILLSLYYLVHSSDSQTTVVDIENLLHFRYREAPFASTSPTAPLSPDIQSARRALSVFQDPVPLARFASWMAMTGLKLTTAHYRLLGQLSPDGSLIARHRIEVEHRDVERVGLWVRGAIENPSVEMTAFDKQTVSAYANTILFLLRKEEGARSLLDHTQGTKLLTLIAQFFKQTGRWVDWLAACQGLSGMVAQFADAPPEVRKNLEDFVSLEIVWVLFWQRKYAEAEQHLASKPHLQNSERGRTYLNRINYRKAISVDDIDRLLHDVEDMKDKRIDDLSLLGQLFARRALLDPAKRNESLSKAKVSFEQAHERASKEGLLRDIAVQSCYLAYIHADLGDLPQARKYIAEVRRIDGAILRRVPGEAWQWVAEYRVELAERGREAPTAVSLRRRAVEALDALGMQGSADFVEREYY